MFRINPPRRGAAVDSILVLNEFSQPRCVLASILRHGG
jgi:hypothetical protein